MKPTQTIDDMLKPIKDYANIVEVDIAKAQLRQIVEDAIDEVIGLQIDGVMEKSDIELAVAINHIKSDQRQKAKEILKGLFDE